MDTLNYTYKGKLWTPCPTTSGNNSFFHSVFGTRADDSGMYFDKHAQFRRMRWAGFLTYFQNEIVPDLLADTLTKCLSASNKYRHVPIEDKQNFAEYVRDITASESNVTMEEIPILATLENTTIAVIANRTGDDVVTVRPNPEILGSYRNIFEKPKGVVLCLEGSTFFRLEPANDNSKPKSVRSRTEKSTHSSKYRKGGSAGSKGVEYQVSLLALVMLNALKKGARDWKMSTENEDAGKFDDVVLECAAGDVLIQCKHKENRNWITLDELTSANSKNEDFSLPKYFLSYQQIRTKFEIKNIVICTNADVHGKALEFLDRQKVCSQSILHYEGADYCLYKFNNEIIPNLIENVKKYYLRHFKNKDIEERVITEDNVKDFLERLQLFFNYTSRSQLEKNIDKLLTRLDCCNSSENKIFFSEIYPKVMDWFQQKDGTYLTENHAKAMFSEIWRDKYCQKLEQYEVSFQNNDFKFQDSSQAFHITCVGGYLLQMIKIYRAIQSDKIKLLFANLDDEIEIQKLVVEAFSLPQYTFLIIVSPKTEDSINVEIYYELNKLLKTCKYKKIILITENDSELVQQMGLEEVSRLDGCITFEDLSKDSQEWLLKKKSVNFQGRLVSLEELFVSQTFEEYSKFLSAEILEKVIREEGVKVGSWPSDLNEDTAWYYISRRFLRENTKKVDDNGSNGKTNVFSEEIIYDVEEKVVVIADSAGMGKSTVLTKLATTIKQKHPHLWVIKINLNDSTRTLSDFLRTSKRTISVMEFLNSQEVTKLASEFERFVFSVSGKIILMLDGVDEISPDYTDLILDLLRQCHNASNIAKIFITTRPHVTQDMEKKLKVALFQMIPFTRQNQMDFLVKYWMHNLKLDYTSESKCEHYAEALIAKMISWVKSYHFRENPFAAIPLQVRMMADIFQENTKWKECVDWQGCQEYLCGDEVEPKLPAKFNIAEMYDIFIEKKRNVFVHKESPNGIPAANQALIDKFDECLDYHRSLALEEILSKKQSYLFSSYRQRSENMELYVLKIGIVQKCGGKLQFLHRTFAEYFVAQSIQKELEVRNSNVDFQTLLIDEILLRRKFYIVRAFLDSFLRKIVDALPPTAFETYQHKHKSPNTSNENPIFVLSNEGCVAILQLILKSIKFRVTRSGKVSVADLFGKMNKKTNTLKNLQAMTRKYGVNISDENGYTPLHHAVKEGHLEMVKFLIKQGASIDRGSSSGRTALHSAAEFGNLDILKYLVKRGADVTNRDPLGRTVLHLAVWFDNLDTVEYLVELGVDINSKDDKGRTALHLASKSGNLDILKYLVERGADVNSGDPVGCRVLHLAVWYHNLDTVKYLVQRGADAKSADCLGNTALHLAAKSGKLDTVKYLMGCGLDVDAQHDAGFTILHKAAESGNVNTVKYLAELGADISRTDRIGRTVLHSAARFGNLEIVKYLLDLGADINRRDREGRTALHLAARFGNLLTVKYLVVHGADVNGRDVDGGTALHSATKFCNLNIVKYFLESGLDVNVKNNDGLTPYHLAPDWFKKCIVEYLQEVNAGLTVEKRSIVQNITRNIAHM